MTQTTKHFRRRGFTRLEFLAALGVIALAVGLFVPAYNRLRIRNKQLVVRAEVKRIEGAWEQYLVQYRQWPTNTDDSVFAVTGRLARILRGEDIRGANTAKVSFIQFTKLDSATNPIVPWVESNVYYYCRFDHDHDGIIRAGGVTNLYPDADIGRRVIVWTTNLFAKPRSTNTIVASWLSQ